MRYDVWVFEDQGEDIENKGGPLQPFSIDEPLCQKGSNDGFFMNIRNFFEESIGIFGAEKGKRVVQKTLNQRILRIG